jgi:predicted transcriptional regulator
MIKDGNFINIQSWMVTELKLKGNELLCYASIFGFSQDGETRFTGSLSYLAEWTNSSKQTIMTTLKSLAKKGLIVKEEIIKNNVKFCEYYAKNLDTVLKKFDGGSQKICIGGSQKICTNNKDKDNKEDNKEDNEEKPDIKQPFFDNEELNQIFLDFIADRKKRGKKMTDKAIELTVKKLKGFRSDSSRIKAITESIANGWIGIFEPAEDSPKKKYDRTANANFDGLKSGEVDF